MFNIKRVSLLLKKDLVNGLRDSIFVYILIAPLLIAVFLRFFIPALGANSIDVVVLEGHKSAVIAELRDFTQVEYVRDIDALEARVLKWDDTVGVVDPGGSQMLTIITEGNENEAVIEMVGAALNKISGTLEGASVREVNLGKPQQPAAIIVAMMMCFMALMLGGMLAGFTMAEEKELNTRQSLRVSPLTNLEYMAGKTITGMVVALFLVLLYTIILGVEFDLPKLLVVSLAGVMLSAIFGYLVGNVSNNQLTAIANAKIGSMLFIAPPIAALLLPASKHFLLYWIPTYWAFAGYRSIFWDNGTWAQIMPLFGWNMVANMVLLALVYYGVKKHESRT